MRNIGDPAEQLQMADSFLQRLDHPNILRDPNLQWNFDPRTLPRASHPQVTVTRLAVHQQLVQIGIPQIPPGDGSLLREPPGGIYTVLKGSSILTLAKERELDPLARAGAIAGIQEYMDQVINLPDDLKIYSWRQDSMPIGFDNLASRTGYPDVWPSRQRSSGTGCLVVTLKLPCSFQSFQNDRNSRIVTLLFSDVPTDYNGFTGAMRRLVCWTCSCLRGARTASCCCHVTAAQIR